MICDLQTHAASPRLHPGEKGAAYQMDTQPRTLHDGGVDFVVRVATSLQDKPKAPKSGDTK